MIGINLMKKSQKSKYYILKSYIKIKKLHKNKKVTLGTVIP